MIKEINTIEDVRQFAFQLVNDENLSFHPDDDFADYINTETKLPSYNKEDISRFNNLMAKCFVVCEKYGQDIYDLMGEPLYRKLKIGSFYSSQN
ncbi:MAG: hypothetical protein JXR27_02635 [Paludibacteraceae bacterium]|nr:hypothetical protein [Paludibacteraceae bacterium]